MQRCLPVCVAVLLTAVPLSLSAQDRKPLIAFGGISHESDSFNPAKTTLADFGARAAGPAPQVLAELAKGNTVASGFIEGAKRFDLDLYPVLLTGAAPKGPVTDEAFTTLVDELIRQVKAAPHLDGLLLANHGAMVVESYPHGDTELIRRVRAALGPGFPIVVVHDFHANETPEIVKLTTALIIYKENPHIDTKERGIQAARIMADTVRGKVKPVQAIVKPPMVYNIVFQHTRSAPLLPVVEESRRLEKDPRILAASVAGGYQYADSEQMGPSAVVVTNGDRELAEREARRLSDMLWATRDQLKLNLPDAAAAVRQAMASDRFPVALIDMGDNIGGGSSGDGTFLLEELLRQKAEGWVVVIADPEAVQAAVRAGIGGHFDMDVGGKTDQFHGKPVRVRGRVKSLHDGKYVETEIRHGGGRYYDMGLTAVIEAEGSTRDLPNLLLVTTRRSSPNSLHQLISCGVYPTRQRILTVKGAIAPRAAYEPIAARIIGVDTPGLTSVNPARYTYKRVRRPLFGLE
jgi:microcystin degradation protein MlrC